MYAPRSLECKSHGREDVTAVVAMAIYAKRTDAVETRPETYGQTERELQFCVRSRGNRSTMLMEKANIPRLSLIGVREDNVRSQ